MDEYKPLSPGPLSLIDRRAGNTGRPRRVPAPPDTASGGSGGGDGDGGDSSGGGGGGGGGGANEWRMIRPADNGQAVYAVSAAGGAWLWAATTGGGGRGRGLYSFTSQLNLSAWYGIGGARRGCVALVKGVSGGFRVCRVFVCQTRLKLS